MHSSSHIHFLPHLKASFLFSPCIHQNTGVCSPIWSDKVAEKSVRILYWILRLGPRSCLYPVSPPSDAPQSPFCEQGCSWCRGSSGQPWHSAGEEERHRVLSSALLIWAFPAWSHKSLCGSWGTHKYHGGSHAWSPHTMALLVPLGVRGYHSSSRNWFKRIFLLMLLLIFLRTI